MAIYKLTNPCIKRITWRGNDIDCVMGMAYDPREPLGSGIFFESIDESYVSSLKPYVEKTRGGLSTESKEIPNKLLWLCDYKSVIHEFDSPHVKLFNEFHFYYNCLVTEENGIEYLEAVPYQETGCWDIDKYYRDGLVYFDNMKPLTYTKIYFLCKYNNEKDDYADGWQPKEIGERIRVQFFRKYDSIKYPIVHYNHNRITTTSQKEHTDAETSVKKVGYIIPDLSFEFNDSIFKYAENRIIYPILLFPNQDVPVFPYRRDDRVAR